MVLSRTASWFIPVGGILGLGVCLGLRCVGYLAIQVFVYLSFSLSFAHCCILGWFRSHFVSQCMWSYSRLVASLVVLYVAHRFLLGIASTGLCAWWMLLLVCLLLSV